MTQSRRPSLSVITVAFNNASTIGDTLSSVASQQNACIEHLVIDGGSTDGTLEAIRAAPSVARLISEPDDGIYDAMNKGLAIASGDLVGFLNADDIYEDFLSASKITDATMKGGANIVYGDLVYSAQQDLTRVIRRWKSGTFDAGDLKYGWMPPHPTFYVARGLLSQIGVFDTSLRIAADYDFMLRCLLHPSASASYVPEVLVRMRAGGASNRSIRAMLNKSREDLRVMKRHAVGGIGTLTGKNLRKLPQFLAYRGRRD